MGGRKTGRRRLQLLKQFHYVTDEVKVLLAFSSHGRCLLMFAGCLLSPTAALTTAAANCFTVAAAASPLPPPRHALPGSLALLAGRRVPAHRLRLLLPPTGMPWPPRPTCSTQCPTGTWYTAVSGCVRCGHDATAVELPRGMPERTTVGRIFSGNLPGSKSILLCF